MVLNINDHDLLPPLLELVDEFDQFASAKGIQIVCNFDQNLSLKVMVDTMRLNQIITNLIDNAIKYNKTGKTIHLSIDVSDTYTRLNIDDDGDAIAENYHNTLFEAQNRAGRELSADLGSGLGLSISKTLVELMGGRIGYNVLTSGGNRFWVEFLNASSQNANALSSEQTG